MNKELTPEEQAEFDSYGAIRYSVDDFCERFDVKKTALANTLNVTRIQINNYRKLDRVIEFNPENNNISVIAKEKEVNQGVLA